MKKSRFVFALALMTSVAHGQNSLGSQKGEAMQETISSLVKDDKRFTQSEVHAISQSLESDGRKGVWILGPKALALDVDPEATIYGWDYYDFKTRGLRYVHELGAVIVTRLESRETFATTIEEPKEPSEPVDVQPEPEVPDGDNLITFRFGLRDRLQDLPWKSGTYLVDIAMDGLMSNRVQINMTPGKAAERDPAIAAYIEEQKGRAASRLDFFPPLATTPAPAEASASLPVPRADGIVLKVDRVSVYTPTAHNVLQGSFRLTLPPGFYRNAEAGGPTATVPITLVITGNDLLGPFVAPLRVATFDPINKRAPESEVTGHFAVDLFALDTTSKIVQTYTIWAYCGAVRSEPVINAIITPDMLQ